MTTTLRRGGGHVHYTMGEVGDALFLDALTAAQTSATNLRRIAERGSSAGVAPRSFVGCRRAGTCLDCSLWASVETVGVIGLRG